MKEPSWEDEFGTLAKDFMLGVPSRLQGLRLGLAQLRDRPKDSEALGELKRAFHRLAGTALTFGHLQVAAFARQGEELCHERWRQVQPVAPADLARWKSLVNAIELAFAGVPPSTVDGWRHEIETPTRPTRPADILIVDADAADRGMISRLLAREGMECRTATDRAEAAACLDVRLPDALIVGFDGQTTDGFQLVQELRALPGGELTAVIMLSRRNTFFEQTQALHAGADACLDKPARNDVLLRKLYQLLDRGEVETPRVLVVEDDASQAAFVRRTLEQAGYLVHVCQQPRTFSDEFHQFKPDLIVMDIVLPEVSGHDLARFVRQDDQYAALPILFVTAESHQQARIRTFAAGGDDHLIKPVHPVLLVSSVAARLERARLLKALLGRDGLTRLLTHSRFMEQARALTVRKRLDPHGVASMVLIDLDRFKHINDSFGHLAGDQVLVSLSSLLRRHVRRADPVGRYGGEEFGILLDNVCDQDAVKLTTRLLAEFAEIVHHAPDGTTFTTTFSGGVARLTYTMDLNAWFNAADGALYAAKKAGRNRVVRADV